MKLQIAVVLGLAMATLTTSASASLIVTSDVVPITTNFVGSGNGTLDYLFFTGSVGGSTNTGGSFNGDNSNTDLPTGGGNNTANESFVTSIGDLRNFYITNFPNGSGGSTVNHLALFLDVDEAGGTGATISLDLLDIFISYNATFGDARDTPFASDVTSSQQNAINASFTGGTKIRELDSAKTLVQTNPGGGHADAVIYTHINPFDPAFTDSTRILFHVALSGMDNGAEAIFLDGSDAPQNVPGFVPLPEPSSLILAGLGGVVLVMAARRNRKS